MKLPLQPLFGVIISVIFISTLSRVDAGGGGGSRYVNTGSYLGEKRQNTSVYEPLLDDMFQGYNPLAMPICQGNKPLHLMLDMWLYQLFDLDEPKQELTLDVWIDLNWIDCSINWDPSKFNGIKEVVLPAHEVWHPDIFSYQGLHGNYEEGLFIFRESKVKINHKGVVQLGAQLILRTFCRVNIARFPFDDQSCNITFTAWNKDLTVFNMTKKPKHDDDVGHTFENASNGEWLVVSLLASDGYKSIHVDSETSTENFSEVTFTLNLKRKPKFIQVYLMFPCMLLLWIAAITFVLPVSCGEKVSLVSTVLLSMIVFLLVVAGYVPHSSDSVPIIGKFYFCSIALVAFAMLMTTIVLNVSHKDSNIAMPSCIEHFLYSNFSFFFCFNFPKPPKNHRYNMIKCVNCKDPSAEICGALSDAQSDTTQINQWEQLALLLDRMFLLIYVILCLINTVYMVTVH